MAHDKVIERQGFVTIEGDRVEKEIISTLVGNDYINENTIIGQGPSHRQSESRYNFKGKLIDIQELYINYEDGRYIIDADIIVYCKDKKEILCVISSKKSFRERGSQTAYWATKLQEKNKKFKYILVTPDVDKELFHPNKPDKMNKWRTILTDEMDAIFVMEPLKETAENAIIIPYNKIYEYNEKFYVGNKYLIDYITTLIDN